MLKQYRCVAVAFIESVMNMEMPLVSRRCLFASNDYQDRLQQRRKIRQAVVEAHQGGQMGASYAKRIRAETIPEAETIRLYPAESKMPAPCL